MNEKLLVGEWEAARRRSIQMLPVALVLFVGLSAVVLLEKLHKSEFGFMAGVLVGAHGYWVALEAMTIVRVSRLFPRAAATGGSNPTSCRI